MEEAAEKQRFLTQHLEDSRDALEKSIKDVDEALWNAKPSEERWSIGECAEHILLVEKIVGGRLQTMEQLPEEEYDQTDSRRKDELIPNVAVRGEQRFQAPPHAHAKGEYKTATQFLRDFHETRSRLIAISRKSPTWLRGRFVEHPVLKKLDGYQWLLVCSAHAARHAAQINEIKEQLLV